MKKQTGRLLAALAVSAALMPALPARAQRAWAPSDNVAIDASLTRQTFEYARKDTSVLKMDVFTRPGLTAPAPCVVFMFGGGFLHGDRNMPAYNLFFNRMAQEGFVVATIDYRLGLKDAKLTMEDPQPLVRAVDMAVSDLFSATEFLIGKAAQLHIDTSRIVIAGSSAGALTVLSADWNKRNATPLARQLPAGFQYAGVMSFAGALVSTTGLPRYATPPAPTMLFHGTLDSLVFYDGIRRGQMQMLSSPGLAALFSLEGYPYYFKRYEDMGHEISRIPMRDDLDQIVWFIREYVEGGKRYEVEVLCNDPERQRTYYTTFWTLY